jgi:DNA repair protein RecN (Recombination protein N)
MLQALKIQNLAVIDAAQLEFKEGLNIISGETGAGKSILLQAISLILGGRASSELVRSGCEEAVIEGYFDLSEHPSMSERLQRFGFNPESKELLIRRLVHASGKNRIYVNGQLATLSILQELCDGLVDLCGQHEHQSLLKSQVQLELLDRYGGLEKLSQDTGLLFSRFRSLRSELDLLRSRREERVQREEFLKFQVEELASAGLEPEEEDNLQNEKKLLQSLESRVQNASHASSLLDAEDGGALHSLRIALQRARSLAEIDSSAQGIVQSLERTLIEAEEASAQLGRYVGSCEMDPERLSAVQERLALIASFRRKYGASVPEMIETLARLQAELAQIENVDGRVEEIEAELATVEKSLLEKGKELSRRRTNISATLSASVSKELKDLKMEGAQFAVEVAFSTDLSTWSAHAAGDEVQFIVRTNRGESARPIGKIASGGELSRLMLAIRRVISDKGGIGVYLFDEIDAGLGGETAFQVGKKLKSVAAHNQVICITHLPQVAAFAAHHLSVVKESQGKRTVTQIRELEPQGRKEEIARMLAGPKLTKTSLQNASELMGLAMDARA